MSSAQCRHRNREGCELCAVGCFVSDGEKGYYCYPESINTFKKEPDTKQCLRNKSTVHRAATINSWHIEHWRNAYK